MFFDDLSNVKILVFFLFIDTNERSLCFFVLDVFIYDRNLPNFVVLVFNW